MLRIYITWQDTKYFEDKQKHRHLRKREKILAKVQ